jgi:hypothetical protein
MLQAPFLVVSSNKSSAAAALQSVTGYAHRVNNGATEKQSTVITQAK